MVEEESDPNTIAVARSKEMESTCDLVRANATKYQENYSKPTTTQLLVGQEVFIKNNVLSNAAEGVTASLCPKWMGPYIIESKMSENVYMCKHTEDLKDKRKVDISNIQIKGTPHTRQ